MASPTTINWLRRVRWIASGIIVIAAAVFAYTTAKNGPGVQNRAEIGGEFSLVDHTGKAVSYADYRDKPVLIYFGYAYCPDVCPTALQQMGAAMDILGKDARKVQNLFITIDPERDTIEMLSSYVTSNGFPAGLTGLTGSSENVIQAAAKWKVIYRRSAEVRDEGNYLMDHSSIIYFMDKKGEFIAGFSHEDSPQTMARCITDHFDGKPCRR